MSSNRWYMEVPGALLSSKVKAAVYLVLFVGLCLGIRLFAVVWQCEGWRKAFILGMGLFLVYLVWDVVHTLTPVYCLRRKELRITLSQTVLLLAFGAWLVAVFVVLGLNKQSVEDSPSYIVVSAVGILLGWIFQDTIRSVVAFFYLRLNGLLKIDDWIEVKAHGIDGVVRGISLTTVVIENWDNGTSSFPTHILQSENFKNYQKILDGKTHGRQMQKTFIIDTGWIHTMQEDELARLQQMDCIEPEKRAFLAWYVDEKRTKEHRGVLNIELYRQYLYHWLMHHPHVTHEPRLVVRWLEQVPEGLPLQIYAFITDCSLAAFEWQQSQIMEHAVGALAWFHLQLYQSASGYDASNSNITLVQAPADYRRKCKDNGEIL